MRYSDLWPLRLDLYQDRRRMSIEWEFGLRNFVDARLELGERERSAANGRLHLSSPPPVDQSLPWATH